MRKTEIPAEKSSSSKPSRRMAPPGPDITSFTSNHSYHNLIAAELFERAPARGEGHVSDHDALVVLTGRHTGRSASDKIVVRDAASEKQVWWDNNTRYFSPIKSAMTKFKKQDRHS